MINLNEKTFVITVNEGRGAKLPPGSIFVFTQHGASVRGRFWGGPILEGALSGTIEGRKMTYGWNERDIYGNIFSGEAEATLTMHEGKIRLEEEWMMGDGGGVGRCVIEEIDCGDSIVEGEG